MKSDGSGVLKFCFIILFNGICSVILDLDADFTEARKTMLQETFIFDHIFYVNLIYFHKVRVLGMTYDNA